MSYRDPMAGSGTTLRVAQQLARNFLGIEEQPNYIELINEQLGRQWQQNLF